VGGKRLSYLYKAGDEKKLARTKTEQKKSLGDLAERTYVLYLQSIGVGGPFFMALQHANIVCITLFFSSLLSRFSAIASG
jgi:hypothetical protein